MNSKNPIFTSEVYPVAANGRFMAVISPATWMDHAAVRNRPRKIPAKFIGKRT
jgi:hypothetical protein